MNTKNFLIALSLVFGSACFASERVPAPISSTGGWASSQASVIVASRATHVQDSDLSSTTHTSVTPVTDNERVNEDASNFRLMLIGVLLIAVVALRGRKN